MRREPSLAAAQELIDLVAPDPVVLVVVEHRDQYVEVPKQILQPDAPAQGQVVVRTVTPLGSAGVDRLPARLDLVAERHEESLDEARAAAARERGDLRNERNRRFRELGALVGAPIQGAP